MAALAKAGIEGLAPVASNVSLYRPKNVSSRSSSSRSPALVVLCSWMGAAPKHISKYTAGYQSLFPGTPILLVQSSMADTFASDTKQRSRLEVAAKIIMSFKSDATTNGPILLHAMSNGGGIATTRIAAILREQGHGNKTFDKLIFDCLPGKPDVEQGVRAVCVSLPKNPLIRFIGVWLIRIYMHVGLFIVCTILRREDILTRHRRRLHDTTLFSKASEQMCMYSKNDQLVGHADVHEHAEEARRQGWQGVEEVVFEKAPHCGLLMEDAERYWGSIRNFADARSQDSSRIAVGEQATVVSA